MRLCLNLNLDLNLNRWPYPALNRALFRTPFQKSFPSSFRYLQGLMYPSLLVLVNLAPCRRMLPPRQSLGRPLHGRIAVPAVPDHYI